MRPRMNPEQKKRNFTTKLSPEWFKFLDEMKKNGHSKASIINRALEMLKESTKEQAWTKNYKR